MTVTWGKIHKYHRMTIDSSLPEKLILSMVDYIVKMLYDIPEVTRGGASTPEAQHLFDIV